MNFSVNEINSNQTGFKVEGLGGISKLANAISNVKSAMQETNEAMASLSKSYPSSVTNQRDNYTMSDFDAACYSKTLEESFAEAKNDLRSAIESFDISKISIQDVLSMPSNSTLYVPHIQTGSERAIEQIHLPDIDVKIPESNKQDISSNFGTSIKAFQGVTTANMTEYAKGEKKNSYYTEFRNKWESFIHAREKITPDLVTDEKFKPYQQYKEIVAQLEKGTTNIQVKNNGAAKSVLAITIHQNAIKKAKGQENHTAYKNLVKQFDEALKNFTNGEIKGETNIEILQQVWSLILTGNDNFTDTYKNDNESGGKNGYKNDSAVKHVINALVRSGDYAFSNMWEAFLIAHPNNKALNDDTMLKSTDIVNNFFYGSLSTKTLNQNKDKNFIRCQLNIKDKMADEADVFRVKYAKVEIPEKKRDTITFRVGGVPVEVLTASTNMENQSKISIDSDSFLGFHQAILNQTNLLADKHMSGNHMYTGNRQDKYSLVVRFNSVVGRRYKNLDDDYKKNVNWNNMIYVFEDVIFLGTGTELQLTQQGGSIYQPEYDFLYRQSYWMSIEE